MADDVDEYWDDNGSKIEIGGRDKSMILLENDAEPKTYYKLKLSAFISKTAGPYGFKAKVNSKHDKVISKNG
jgi:prophage tail gpP-like protein